MMETSGNSRSGDDPLDGILAEYLQAADSGTAPDQQAFIARHPEVAAELREFFASQEQFEDAARPFRFEAIPADREPESDGSKLENFSSAAGALTGGMPPDAAKPPVGAPAALKPPVGSALRTDSSVSRELVRNADPTQNAHGEPRNTGDLAPAGTVSLGSRIRYFGEYELLEEIARGGMGVVFKARQVRLNRVVALKMILAGQFASAEDVKRFQVEAENAAQLDHPNIVPIYEVGKHKGQHYFTMKLVEGGSLAANLERFRGKPRESARLMVAVAGAVQYAHQRGILHRDLKPGNILLGDEGQPQITNFGLARGLDADTGLTLSGDVLGSPRYMSLEQARGEKGLTVAADEYALGAILYELLGGRPPFDGTTVLDTLQQVREAEPKRLSAVNPKIDRDLETICFRCLRKDPLRRYGSARALADDLERWLRDEPIAARPVRAPERLWRWCRHKPTLATLAALALTAACLVVALAVEGVWLRRAADRERARQRGEDSERRLHDARIADMQTQSGLMAMQHNDDGQALLWFAHAAATDAADRERQLPDELRVAAWTSRVATPLAALPHDGAELDALEFDPSGRFLATHAADGRFRLWDWAAERDLPLAGSASTVNCAAWSFHNQRLAIASGNEAVIYALPKGRELRRLKYASSVTALAYSTSGLLAVASGLLVQVCDPADGAPQGPTLQQAAPVRAICFSPAGDRLVTAAHRVPARLYSLKNQVPDQEKPLFTFPHDRVEPPGASARPIPPMFQDEGKTVVTVTSGPRQDLRLTWYDASSGAERFAKFLPATGALVASPDCAWLLAAGNDGQVRLFADGATLEASWQQGPSTTASFSQDSQRVAIGTAGGQACVYSVDGGAMITSPIIHQSAVRVVSSSPDGRIIATAQPGGLVRVWAPAASTLPKKRLARIPESEDATKFAPLARITRDNRYFIPGGQAYFRGNSVEEIRVCDVAGNHAVSKPLRPSLGINDHITDAEFAPDGKQLAILTPGGVELWDWRTGQRSFAPLPTSSPPLRFSYSPATSQAAVLLTNGGLLFVDASSGSAKQQASDGLAPVVVLPNDTIPPSGLLFSPDGKTLVAWRQGASVRLRDGVSGALRCPPLIAERQCHDLSFSADSAFLAASAERSAYVLDAASGLRVGALLAHPDYVYVARFSPDGARMLTACRDGVARLWDWHAGRVLASFQDAGPVYDVAFAAGGRWIITLGANAGACCWDATDGKPITPIVPLDGFGWSAVARPDGGVFAVGGPFGAPRAVAIANLNLAETWSTDDQCLRSEVLSGLDIQDGGAVSSLSPAQWLERWHRLRARHPQYPDLGRFRETPVAPNAPSPRTVLSTRSGDWPMWGGTPARNMVAPGRPPTYWDVETNTNIKWVADMGTKSYGDPVIADGVVYVGTNNESTRDPKTPFNNYGHPVDGGVLMAFDAKTGEFLWEKYHAKLATGRINDWPGEGLCGTAYVDAGRLWYCSNQCHVACLDVGAGNRQKTEPGVLWDLDMIKKLGVFPHNMTRCAIASYQDNIYVVTANGVDDTHKHVVAPGAPDLLCLNKYTGEVIWSDNSPGANILHGQWASPAIAAVDGRTLVIVPQGDSWVRAFDAGTGKLVWKFDANTKDSIYPQGGRNEILASPCIIDNRWMYIATGQDPEHGSGYANFWCVDITKTGDVSAEIDNPDYKAPVPGQELTGALGTTVSAGIPNPNSGVRWLFGPGKRGDKEANRMHRTMANATVYNGLVFIPDFSGFVHCLDAATGEHYWSADLESETWGSCLASDGKIYMGDKDGDVSIFAADKELKQISQYNMGSSIMGTPVYANGILYVLSMNKLYAIQREN
jgi:WD40 repeat protein/outer membrane protein assembly factor BamB/tRNA A-37 threonylcarbamoyl transferase component Bud32